MNGFLERWGERWGRFKYSLQLIYNNHGREIRDILEQLIRVLIASLIFALIWTFGWERGVGNGFTWHLMYILEDVVPGPVGVAFVFPISVLVGLMILYAFDPFKRLQGILLLSTSLLAIAVVAHLTDRFNIPLLNPSILTAAGLGLLVGMLIGRFWQPLGEGNARKFGQNARRPLLIGVSGIGILGIAEAAVDYSSPIQYSPFNPSTVYGVAMPAEYGSFEYHGLGAENGLLTGFLVLVGLIALVEFVRSFRSFNQYELETDVFILGPDRSGKSWFFGSVTRDIQNTETYSDLIEDPAVTDYLVQLVNEFGNLDEILNDNEEGKNDSEIFHLGRATPTEKYHFIKAKFVSGTIFKREVTIRAIDYGGEIMGKMTDDNGNLHDKNAWRETDTLGTYNELPTFDRLEDEHRHNMKNSLDEEELAKLLIAYVYESDTVGFVIPMDEFALDIENKHLPRYPEPKTIQEIVDTNRQIPPFDEDGGGYVNIYLKLLDNIEGNKILVCTKSDLITKKFRIEYNVNEPDEDWWQFKTFLLDEFLRGDNYGYNTNALIASFNMSDIIPIYLEEDRDKSKKAEQFVPQTDQEGYSTRGLNQFLNKIG